MKKLLAVLALSTALSFSTAAANKATEVCTIYSNIANDLMAARQANIPISDVYAQISDEVSISMMEAAYLEPVESTAEKRELASIEFSNDMFLICIRALGDKEPA
tara:strand:- start:179 stop:493 length:315 start_codon:yes stop_codon:yes gene_type:complete